MDMTQQDQIDRLARQYGRVAVRDGFRDGHIDVTTEWGWCWRVSADGVVTEQRPNQSIDWRQ
jgi:hypothetical protein